MKKKIESFQLDLPFNNQNDEGQFEKDKEPCKVFDFMSAYKKRQQEYKATLVRRIIDSVKHLNY